MADQDQQYWSDDEVIAYLKKLRIAIDEGLANAGVEADEVSGFALGAFQVSAPSASPAMLRRLGPAFSPAPGGLGADNGVCGIICGTNPGGLGGSVYE